MRTLIRETGAAAILLFALMSPMLNAMNVPNCIPYENPSCRPGGSGEIFTPLGSCFQHLDCGTGCACNYKVTIYDPCTCQIKGEWFAFDVCSDSYLFGFPSPTGFVPDSSPGAILALFRLKPSPPAIYQRVYEKWNRERPIQVHGKQWCWRYKQAA